MAQRYPMVKPWLEYHRVSDDEYEIENEIAPGEIDEDPLRLPGYFVDFMQKLDGKTNPYIIDPSINKRTVRTYIRFLSKKGYLRDAKRNRDVGRLAFSVVKFDGKPKYSKTAVLLNLFLSLLWVPVLVCGIVLGVKAWNNYAVFDDTNEMAMRLNIGDCLAFGSFIPSFDSSDVPVRLPMLWYVIDKQGSRLKLLSYFFFEHTGCWSLHRNPRGVTWKETDIRRHLNNKYFNDCFSEREREAILTTEVNTKTYDSSIITTNDKLFLPALEDIENIPEHLKIGRGVYANCFNDDIPSVELLYCFYWLRDPGENKDENLVVQGYADSKLVIDSLDHNADEVGVRAVMWIDAEKIK